MTTTYSDAFLADILEHPKDDTPRLIYADWLEEHGESERAAFIRVQCELATVDDGSGSPPVQPNNAGMPLGRWSDLRQRERELLDKYRREWFWLPGFGYAGFGESQPLCWWVEGDSRGDSRIAEGVPRRGFVAEVYLDYRQLVDHGREIVKHQPIEKVILRDKQPIWMPPRLSGYQGNFAASLAQDRWMWLRVGQDMPRNPHWLPPFLYDRLRGGDKADTMYFYDSKELAIAGLSNAALSFCKG